jgi:hypothetical protein
MNPTSHIHSPVITFSIERRIQNTASRSTSIYKHFQENDDRETILKQIHIYSDLMTIVRSVSGINMLNRLV